MFIVLQYFIVALKVLVPALMLWFPFLGVWGNYFLDVIDGDILRFLGMGEYVYQTVDKITDFISYFFMLGMGIKLKIRKIVFVLFTYRAVGQLLFFMTRNEEVFFYFQNFLEPLLMIYTFLLLKLKDEDKAFYSYKKNIILIWIIVLAYKIWNEWYLHVANIDLSTIFFGFNGGS
jgi:hypothetical protein